MRNTETLFLVHDNKSEILEINVLLDKSVRSDYKVDLAPLSLPDDVSLLLCVSET